MRRRTFLRSVAATLAALPLASLGGCGSPRAFDPSYEYAALLTAYFGADGLDDARALGDHCSRLGAASESALRSTMDLVDGQPDEAQAVLALREAVVADFAARAIVDVEGWILSSTEVSLCVLVSRAFV